MSEFVVPKYGGSSMARPELVQPIVESRPDQRIIVVSAPGKDHSTSIKMTDALIQYADHAKHGKAGLLGLRDEIVERMDSLYPWLGESERAGLRTSVAKQLIPGHGTDKEYFTSLGEVFSAEYFAKFIGARCVFPEIYFHGNGLIDRAKTNRSIRAQASKYAGRLVVPGFFGFDEFRRTWLLGRGGSDRTGVIYGSALGWDHENWTDVNGIFSTDPRIYLEAGEPDPTEPLEEVTGDEVREGAHGGSGVLQGDTILDLNGSKILVTVKNTQNPDAPGTRVVQQLTLERDRPVIAISGRSDLVRADIHDLGMADRKGYVAELLTFLAESGLSFEHLPASQDSFGLTLHKEVTDNSIKEFVEFARQHRLSPHGEVTIDECGVVYVVGESLRDNMTLQRITSRVLDEATSHSIPALPVTSNRSPSLALLTDREKVVPLVKAIHKSEIEDKRAEVLA